MTEEGLIPLHSSEVTSILAAHFNASPIKETTSMKLHKYAYRQLEIVLLRLNTHVDPIFIKQRSLNSKRTIQTFPYFTESRLVHFVSRAVAFKDCLQTRSQEGK